VGRGSPEEQKIKEVSSCRSSGGFHDLKDVSRQEDLTGLSKAKEGRGTLGGTRGSKNPKKGPGKSDTAGVFKTPPKKG